MCPSGGSSSTARARQGPERYFPGGSGSDPRISIPWASSSRTDHVSCLRQFSNVEESPAEILLNKEDVDTDGMNYLAGKSVDFVNKSAMNGTILAHTDGNVPT